MAIAMARARLDEPAADLGDLTRHEPLTVGEAVLLAEAVLRGPQGAGYLTVASVVVTQSGSIKLLYPVLDLRSCGRVLCQALGTEAGSGRDLTPIERAAPAFVSCVRALAAGSFDRAEDALEAITEAAGAAGLDPARIRARQRLRLRAQQAHPPGLDLRSVDESPSSTLPKRRFVDKWRRPRPLALASVATVGLVAAYGVLGALLPAQPSVPRAGTPDQAVRMVFDLSAQHRYSDVAGLRSARLQAADPAGRSLRNRFAAAGEVDLVEERVVALDAVHGRATVEVVWTERSAGGTRRLSGVVYLVNSRSGWLWDGGTVA